MDFSFGVPGCGAPEPVTFIDIFELNALLLIYSVLPIVVFMPALMLFFGRVYRDTTPVQCADKQQVVVGGTSKISRMVAGYLPKIKAKRAQKLFLYWYHRLVCHN